MLTADGEKAWELFIWPAMIACLERFGKPIGDIVLD